MDCSFDMVHFILVTKNIITDWGGLGPSIYMSNIYPGFSLFISGDNPCCLHSFSLLTPKVAEKYPFRYREIKRGIPGVASGCAMGDPYTSRLDPYTCTQRTHVGRSTVSTL